MRVLWPLRGRYIRYILYCHKTKLEEGQPESQSSYTVLAIIQYIAISIYLRSQRHIRSESMILLGVFRGRPYEPSLGFEFCDSIHNSLVVSWYGACFLERILDQVQLFNNPFTSIVRSCSIPVVVKLLVNFMQSSESWYSA